MFPSEMKSFEKTVFISTPDNFFTPIGGECVMWGCTFTVKRLIMTSWAVYNQLAFACWARTIVTWNVIHSCSNSEKRVIRFKRPFKNLSLPFIPLFSNLRTHNSRYVINPKFSPVRYFMKGLWLISHDINAFCTNCVSSTNPLSTLTK